MELYALGFVTDLIWVGGGVIGGSFSFLFWGGLLLHHSFCLWGFLQAFYICLGVHFSASSGLVLCTFTVLRPSAV